MTPKRQALSALTKPLLLAVARHFELDVCAATRRSGELGYFSAY